MVKFAMFSASGVHNIKVVPYLERLTPSIAMVLEILSWLYDVPKFGYLIWLSSVFLNIVFARLYYYFLFCGHYQMGVSKIPNFKNLIKTW